MPWRSRAKARMERPSGVSSASEASTAASATSRSVTPGAGTKAAAWRLPSVMVPVLSSSSTSTSPAASTARPEVASTLKRTSRSMPAMPMAESRPPIVVGIRVISSAASTGTEGGWPFQLASPTSVATAIRKMIVMPASRMSSAISFGVFCREAPSTSAIMRSRKVEPGGGGDAHHEPVGDHQRAAGDGAAVAARSRGSPARTRRSRPPRSREAMPSITSPSEGMRSPASTSTTSSDLQLRRVARLPQRAVVRADQQLGPRRRRGTAAGCPPAPGRVPPPPPRRRWRTAR